MPTDRDKEEYVKYCRPKFLLQYFDEKHVQQPNPLHLKCNNCSVACKYGLKNYKVLSYILNMWILLIMNSSGNGMSQITRDTQN